MMFMYFYKDLLKAWKLGDSLTMNQMEDLKAYRGMHVSGEQQKNNNAVSFE